MTHLSELIGSSVRTSSGARVGRVADVVVAPNDHYPVVNALVIGTSDGKKAVVPWSSVRAVDRRTVTLRGEAVPNGGAEEAPASGVLLARDILDKQIVDPEGARVVRVNDLELASVDGTLRLLGVDVSGRALLRRLGLGPVGLALSQRLPERVIAWQDVDKVEPSIASVRLKVPRKELARLHPADLASVVEELSVQEGAAIIESLDDEIAAQTLEEVDPDRQVSLLQGMDRERAADILEEMGPDDAADVLGDMSKSQANELLGLMDKEESADVRELLAYPEDSAGGIMTTEYIDLPQSMTAQEAIDHIRSSEIHAEMAYYAYVVRDAESETLEGVVTLRQLIVAEPSATLETFMTKDVISVDVRDHQTDVARLIARYNLLAIPVVDGRRRLLGIVTVDDAIDIVLPVAWKKRLPRIFR